MLFPQTISSLGDYPRRVYRRPPILAHADYAVIGDLKTIVPAITAELAKRG